MKFSKDQVDDVRSKIASAISQLKQAQADVDLGEHLKARDALREVNDILLPVYLLFNQSSFPADADLQSLVDEEYHDNGEE